MLVEVIADRPKSFVAIPSGGRVCQALYLVLASAHWFYYTTSGACTLSWSFATVLLIAYPLLAPTDRGVRQHLDHHDRSSSAILRKSDSKPLRMVGGIAE